MKLIKINHNSEDPEYYPDILADLINSIGHNGYWEPPDKSVGIMWGGYFFEEFDETAAVLVRYANADDLAEDLYYLSGEKLRYYASCGKDIQEWEVDFDFPVKISRSGNYLLFHIDERNWEWV